MWTAFGKTLSAGGDKLKFMNPYNKETESHSGLLINGKGIQYAYNQVYVDAEQPAWNARPLAWEEGEEYVYWAVDITPGYFKQSTVTRVVRHVVMLKQKTFVMYDELQVQAGDQVSWLMKLPHRVPVEVSEQAYSFTVEEVNAKVFHAGAPGLALRNLSGREGYLNPITGFDWGPEVNKGMTRMAQSTLKGQVNPDQDFLKEIQVWNNFWSTRKADSNGKAQFLTALVAWKGDVSPTITEISPRSLQFTYADGDTFSVSFDPAQDADFMIDPSTVK